jgi:hypothetical protein
MKKQTARRDFEDFKGTVKRFSKVSFEAPNLTFS